MTVVTLWLTALIMLLALQMTSYRYVEITLWGGQLPPIKEDIEVVDTFLAHPSMAEGAPAQTFFAELSTCHTTAHLYDKIHKHQHHPANAVHPYRYFNPAEYRIMEIAVMKRRLFIQHEGFILRVHHEPPAQNLHLAEPDFLITIDRNIDARSNNPFSSSAKFAIDRVDCSLSLAEQIQGTISHPIVWRMPAPDHNYTFDLNLSQVGVMLDAILFTYPRPQYNALHKNCFSHSRILRAVIIRIIQQQQPAGNNNVVAAEELAPKFCARLGTCLGFHLDTDQGEDNLVFTNYQTLLAQFLS